MADSVTPAAIIPAELAAALYEYLMRRPMVEVEQLVTALRQARPYEEPPARGGSVARRKGSKMEHDSDKPKPAPPVHPNAPPGGDPPPPPHPGGG